jgi:hypothetical protein
MAPNGACDSQRLLAAHHDGIRKTTDQHHQTKDHVHDADPLVIDARDPLPPQIGPPTLEGDEQEDGRQYQANCARSAHDDRLVEGNCGPAESA